MTGLVVALANVQISIRLPVTPETLEACRVLHLLQRMSEYHAKLRQLVHYALPIITFLSIHDYPKVQQRH